MNKDNLLETARKLLSHESEAITAAADRLGEPFHRALEFLNDCRGKVIVTGLGKSGIAAKKIAATLASTGAPALFLHSAEAIHGDMGVVSAGDVAICLSYSGETKELIELLPRFKRLGVPIIAMTGNETSSLARLADCVLDVSVPSYSWPYGLLPTASSAATVAVGDALAVALLVSRGVNEENFAMLHPGGLLGHKMLVMVRDLMHTGEALPLVKRETGMRQVLMKMTAKRLGVTCIIDDNRRLEGVITDGDLRRLLEQSTNPLDLTAEEAMTANPKTIEPEALCARALRIMETKKITSLPVIDKTGALTGLIHMHDILRMETGK
ncbi:KpsF/GutQ family sugar-phosphate isomerase [bacterium]|nr:KpsF/GutQ family sugar-phosphate isomerase [bacterium]